MWVKFSADHWWDVPEHKGRVTTLYPAGETHNITRACADAAVAKGVGTKTTVRNRADAAKVKASRKRADDVATDQAEG